MLAAVHSCSRHDLIAVYYRIAVHDLIAVPYLIAGAGSRPLVLTTAGGSKHALVVGGAPIELPVDGATVRLVEA